MGVKKKKKKEVKIYDERNCLEVYEEEDNNEEVDTIIDSKTDEIN